MAAPELLAQRRPIRTAEIVSVGNELTVGETRNTNAGELARDLSERGVTVSQLVALPDRLEAVVAALRDARRPAAGHPWRRYPAARQR